MSKDLIYLACPYSSPDPAVREQRFHAVNRAAARLMEQGDLIFSPISHSHPIAIDGGLPKDWGFWERYDRAILGCCRTLIVLCLPGWEQSVGVQAEIKIAKELGLDIEYISE
jgi:hypothetical protein